MTFSADTADVAVIGAGHAGVEAALACARMGMNTILFTLSLDQIANMPCNPSIGGTGKGHLVYEIDALGGEMGYAADKVTMQSRTLNLGKGPAVHSKRIQADRMLYHSIMKKTLEDCPGLKIIQSEIVSVGTENGRLCSVTSRLGAVYSVKAAIICSGTYLSGRVITGQTAYASGPDGSLPSVGLSDCLRELGTEILRFKTGTPPRIHRRSIDFSVLERQDGENYFAPYSFRSYPELTAKRATVPCYIAYTNETTHQIIRDNLHLSPLYSGVIKGTGPRYCPSIEDKVVRFADKTRHQLFAEPMGFDTEEIYLQGFSSSLPANVQLRMLHSLKGFENAEVMRFAYAIEYDCINPQQLSPTLEFKHIPGLYGAGQFNGTSGYEEAAAQGLVAGINAALKILGKPPMILSRDSSYIGTLIDDIVTKGTNEPYRIMTSRSEYRLLLRQSNACFRLMEEGRRSGLVSEERYSQLCGELSEIKKEIARVSSKTIAPGKEINDILTENGTSPISTGVKLAELIKRPQLSYEKLEKVDDEYKKLPPTVRIEAEIRIKYEGYISRQIEDAERMKNLEVKKLPSDIDYAEIKGLRLEARQKLNKVRPENIGQASRISGVSPADISVLLIWLKLNKL